MNEKPKSYRYTEEEVQEVFSKYLEALNSEDELEAKILEEMTEEGTKGVSMYFNNFPLHIMSAIQAEKYNRLDNPINQHREDYRSPKRNELTTAEYYHDVLKAISTVGFERDEVMEWLDSSHSKEMQSNDYWMKLHDIKSLQEKFLMIRDTQMAQLLPIYIELRRMGYEHTDLIG